MKRHLVIAALVTFVCAIAAFGGLAQSADAKWYGSIGYWSPGGSGAIHGDCYNTNGYYTWSGVCYVYQDGPYGTYFTHRCAWGWSTWAEANSYSLNMRVQGIYNC